MWKLLQLAVFIGVLFANIYWQWTPNGYLASLLGIGAAYLATVLLSKILLGLRLILQASRWRRPLQQRPY